MSDFSRRKIKRNNSRELSRREFLAATSAAALTLSTESTSGKNDAGAFKGKFCFFSKPFPAMDWQRLAKTVKQMGFDSVDLTVRKKGHVLPESAGVDLPRAVEAIRAAGLEVPMITTELVSASDPTARPILCTAGKLSIPFFKAGYYRYQFVDVLGELHTAGEQFRSLVNLAQQCGIQVGYHNHAGYLGGPIWDMATVMEKLDPRWAGYYFDVRHAAAEGGAGAWRVAANLAAPRIKMIAIKDFYWEKVAGKGWRETNCPLGEGMVDWKTYFALLAKSGFHGPISLHMEYEIAGSTPAQVEENTISAAKRDFAFLKSLVQEAYKPNA